MVDAGAGSALIERDIEAYLALQQNKEILRFLTAGSVDDGKSTLIGRLLHDSNTVYDDQLDALRTDSAKKSSAGGEIDYSLLVDGLLSEREQGITIDVAYRYFATAEAQVHHRRHAPGTSSTRATWPPAPPPPTWPSSSSTPATACSRRRGATASSPRCSASATSSSP